MSIKIIFVTKGGKIKTVTLVGHLVSIFNSSSVSDNDDDDRPTTINRIKI